MVIKRKKIKVGGKEVEVDVFHTKVKLGTGKELEIIEELLKEEEVEKAIQDALAKIEKIAAVYKEKEKNVEYFYEVGKVLQFVDEKNYYDIRGRIWGRMADNLRPELFGGKKKGISESKRYPEFMYLLAKVPKNLLNKASWDQWYEILKFHQIYKDRALLPKILSLCEEGLSGIQLRERIKKIRSTRSLIKNRARDKK